MSEAMRSHEPGDHPMQASPLPEPSAEKVAGELGDAGTRADSEATGSVTTAAEAEAVDATPAPGTLLEGSVSGMVKGGLEVQFGSRLRGFMPASHADLARIKDISILLGQQVRCEVLEVDRKNKKLIVSRRNVLRRELRARQEKSLDELEVGEVRQGTVVNLTDYGAFVDLNGLHGLVHVSDMSWSSIAKPSDVVKPGDEVTVKILRISKERNRVSLGLKQVTPDPWESVASKFPVQTRVQARVVKLADFGAFAEVADGVQALVPLSEMSWNHKPGTAADFVDVGQTIDAVVISVDDKRRRMGLSIRQLSENPWQSIGKTYPSDSVVTGKVTTLLDFGALVELDNGVEGLVHISELAARRVAKTADVVTVGDEVQVKVLSVDAKKRRISLSIKAAAAPAIAPPSAGTAQPATRKHSKLRRGGLSSHFDW